jgi:hypothetical protein
MDESQWKLKHYNVMNTFKKKKGDSPLKKKIHEASKQWANRKDRTSPGKPNVTAMMTPVGVGVDGMDDKNSPLEGRALFEFATMASAVAEDPDWMRLEALLAEEKVDHDEDAVEVFMQFNKI